MTDEQRQRVHAITYSTQDRMELAERIVRLEDLAIDFCSFVDMSCKYGESHLAYSCADFCKHRTNHGGRCDCWYEREMRELGIEWCR